MRSQKDGQRNVKTRIRVGGQANDAQIIAGHSVDNKKDTPSAAIEALFSQAVSRDEGQSEGLEADIDIKSDVNRAEILAAKYISTDPALRMLLERDGNANQDNSPIPTAQTHEPQQVVPAPVSAPASAAATPHLLALYDEMAASNDPRRRGYVLQDLLNELLKANSIPVAKSFTRNDGAEQVDGAFVFGAWHYLVECRWRERLADIRQLDGLKGQVDRSGKQTLGIFLSINGWSDNVIPMLKQNPDKSILLMNGADLRAVLSGAISFQSLLIAKLAGLNLEAEPYLSAEEALQRKF